MQLRDYVEKQRNVKRPNKYGNQKVELDGFVFDSKAEARFYLSLKADKYVSDIEVHPRIELEPGIVYIGDFRFNTTRSRKTGLIVLKRSVLVDIKGHETTAFRIKLRMLKNRGIDVEVLTQKTNPELWRSK